MVKAGLIRVRPRSMHWELLLILMRTNSEIGVKIAVREKRSC